MFIVTLNKRPRSCVVDLAVYSNGVFIALHVVGVRPQLIDVSYQAQGVSSKLLAQSSFR